MWSKTAKKALVALVMAAGISFAQSQTRQPTPAYEQRMLDYLDRYTRPYNLILNNATYQVRQLDIKSEGVIVQESSDYLAVISNQPEGEMFFDFGKDGTVDYYVENRYMFNAKGGADIISPMRKRQITEQELKDILSKIIANRKTGSSLPKSINRLATPDARLDSGFQEILESYGDAVENESNNIFYLPGLSGAATHSRK